MWYSDFKKDGDSNKTAEIFKNSVTFLRGAWSAEPVPNTNQSIGATTAEPSSTLSNLGEEVVKQAPLLRSLNGARDFLRFSNKMKAITEQDIIASTNEVILGVLSSILDETKNSWRYNVYFRKIPWKWLKPLTNMT